jgi:hypothetical protein
MAGIPRRIGEAPAELTIALDQQDTGARTSAQEMEGAERAAEAAADDGDRRPRRIVRLFLAPFPAGKGEGAATTAGSNADLR